MTADRLIYEYSQLDRTEQKEFDKRYRELMKFRRDTAKMMRQIVKERQTYRQR